MENNARSSVTVMEISMNKPVVGGLAVITATNNVDMGIVMRIVSVDVENKAVYFDELPEWVAQGCNISFMQRKDEIQAKD